MIDRPELIMLLKRIYEDVAEGRNDALRKLMGHSELWEQRSSLLGQQQHVCLPLERLGDAVNQLGRDIKELEKNE